MKGVKREKRIEESEERFVKRNTQKKEKGLGPHTLPPPTTTMNATTTRAPVGDNCAAGRPPPRPRPAWPTPRRHPVAIGLSPLKPPSGSAASTSTLTWSPCTRQHRVPRTIRTSPRTLPAHHPLSGRRRCGGAWAARAQRAAGMAKPRRGGAIPSVGGPVGEPAGGASRWTPAGVAAVRGGRVWRTSWAGPARASLARFGLDNRLRCGVSDPRSYGGALTWGTSRNLLHGGQTQQRGSWGAWWQTTLHNYCDTALLH